MSRDESIITGPWLLLLKDRKFCLFRGEYPMQRYAYFTLGISYAW